MRPLLFVDCEMTGLNPQEHELLEVGFLISYTDFNEHRFPVIDGLVVSNEYIYWSQKIKPTHIENAHPVALQVNGYTPEKWKYAQDEALVMQEIAPILTECILVGHNVKIDHAFLSVALEKHTGLRLQYHTVDTVTLAHEHLGHITHKISLENVCNILGISNQDQHTAAGDVIRTYQVYQKLTRATAIERLVWKLRSKIRK